MRSFWLSCTSAVTVAAVNKNDLTHGERERERRIIVADERPVIPASEVMCFAKATQHAYSFMSTNTTQDEGVVDQLNAAATHDAPVSEPRFWTNCYDVADNLEKQNSLTCSPENEADVVVTSTDQLMGAFTKGAWARVQIDCHAYMVERTTSGLFRIYQANAEGPMDARWWLGITAWGKDSRWLEYYASKLWDAHDDTPARWERYFNKLPDGANLKTWWDEILQLAESPELERKKKDFVQKISNKYIEARDTYGKGQELSEEKFVDFVQTPVQVGGGSYPLKEGLQIKVHKCQSNSSGRELA